MIIGDALAIACICALSALAIERGREFVASSVFMFGTVSVIVPGAVGRLVRWLLP